MRRAAGGKEEVISIAKRAEEQDPNDSVISSPGRQHMSGARTQHACTRAHNSVEPQMQAG